MDATRGISNVGLAARLVALQFSFSNPDVVPLRLRQLPPERSDNSQRRQQRPSGTLAIEPTENVDLVGIAEELQSGGFELVDAFYQARIHPRDPKQRFYMVRFVFVRREHARPSERFMAIRQVVLDALREMCEQAMWRVRAFVNPLFVEGQEVFGENAISINLESRKPLYDNAGQPVRQWRKDERNQRIGDAPVPIRPNLRLSYSGSAIEILPAEHLATP